MDIWTLGYLKLCQHKLEELREVYDEEHVPDQSASRATRPSPVVAWLKSCVRVRFQSLLR